MKNHNSNDADGSNQEIQQIIKEIHLHRLLIDDNNNNVEIIQTMQRAAFHGEEELYGIVPISPAYETKDLLISQLLDTETHFFF